jgi:hypothetical protein
MWANKNYSAGGQGVDNLGKLGDEGAANSAINSGGGADGMSQASKMNAGMGLISQAQHVGDALKNIGSWQTQPSAIPSPDDFKYAGPAIAFNPMRTYGNA